jgi:hypothetical protein
MFFSYSVVCIKSSGVITFIELSFSALTSTVDVPVIVIIYISNT